MTEFRYVHNEGNSFGGQLQSSDQNDDRAHRFQCSRFSLLSLLRSWTGLIHLSNPLKSRGYTSPIKAMINVLYLSDEQTRVSISSN